MRIIFNGNGYDDAWIKEATEERGLLNLKTTPDALPCILEQKNVDIRWKLFFCGTGKLVTVWPATIAKTTTESASSRMIWERSLIT